MRRVRALRAPLAGLLALAACGPAPAPTAPTPTTPTAAPAFDAAAWQPLAATVAPCPDDDGRDRCLTVTLPARGFLEVTGTASHDHGCVELHGGVIASRLGDHVADLTMTLPGATRGVGICRAFVRLHGHGTLGPLDAGTWLLRPAEPLARDPGTYGPLHLGAVRFAAAP